jgi:hypothetical protein
MRVLLRIGLCCLLVGSLMAQRRSAGGGGIRGGGIGGGFRSGGVVSGGLRGGYGGFRGGYGYGYRGGFIGYGYYGYPWYGLGYSYDPYSYGYGYSPYVSTYPSYSYPVYEYNPSPNVTVVYAAPQPPAPAYSGTYSGSVPQPATQTYDQYGQQVRPAATAGSSPIYLIATKDQAIRAAASYWVDGRTLHYVTLQHEEKQLPLDTVDRDLSLQLNRERRVQFQLPQ